MSEERCVVSEDSEMQTDSSLLSALRLFVDAYDKWNDREEGGEDDLHYAAKVAAQVLETKAQQ